MSRRAALELVWPGKYGPDGARVEAPAREVALTVEQQIGGGGPAQGLLICGDNLLAMDALLATHAGAIDLVYIDPPFATGNAFERTTRIGGDEAGPELRAHAYHDRWPGGLAGFVQMLDPRLRRIHRLLAPHGSLYVHVDPTVGHAVKLLLDEIFGPGCFQREIVWRIGWVSGFKARANNWIRNHDLIFFYVKDPRRFVFHRQVVPHPPGYSRRRGAATRQGGVPVEDVWNASPAEWSLRGGDSLDSIQIKSFSREKTGWATQKNESLLRRIIAASSDPGGLVADFFCGAGTTLAAAEALGRRWIGCDSAAAAIELAHARLSERADTSFARCGLGAAERELLLSERAETWPALALRLRGAARADGAAGKLTQGTGAAGPGERAEAEPGEGEATERAADYSTMLHPDHPQRVQRGEVTERAADPSTMLHPDHPQWVQRGEATEGAADYSTAGTGEAVGESEAAARRREGAGVSARTGGAARDRGAGEGSAARGPAVRVSARTGECEAAAAAPGGAVGPDVSALGRAHEVAVLVGPLAGPVTRAEVEAAARTASGWDLRALDVLAWEWGFPAGADLSAGTGVDVTCLQLRRAALDVRLAARPELMWGERPVVELRFEVEVGDAGPRARAELVALRMDHLERLAGELRAAAGGVELVEAWAIALAGDAGPFRPDLVATRTRHRRALARGTDWIPLPGPGPWTATARIVDASGGETWHRWRLRWAEGALSVEPCA